ncbi:hypothetical protein [Neptunomonas japonica]|uniref:Uncharacterized protein n=1 Tax=Neptunomonas japonica JAMM 1380 TaxID=1441457 RepID=A0A7R6PNW1_9GAMM|nr:hypothetical protein [Neptunomonas japonica]BBB29922.1 conserved hypothetical protein [Neptunomonas japonica JAMM 1380]
MIIKEEDVNPLVDSEFFWYSLLEGDQIVLDADYYEEGKLILRKGLAYEVLAKTERDISDIAFIVQSDVTDQLISVHPFLVGNYLISPVKYRLN